MNHKLTDRIIEFIRRELDARVMPTISQPLPVGYNPLEVIRGALLHWVPVPFNGRKIWCQLRCPNATQLEQCGDFTNIVAPLKEENHPALTYDQLVDIRNYQEKICEITFNIPTFDHICEVVNRGDFVLSAKKKELEALEKEFEDNKDQLNETQKITLSTQIKSLDLMTGFLIPDDTMAFVTKWAMGNDFSQVQELTRDQFIKAASLAKAYHKAPSDYISGIFTDFNKKEIDTYAFVVLEEYLRDQKSVQKSKMEWFLGGRKRRVALPKGGRRGR
jgi:hypothetical protein